MIELGEKELELVKSILLAEVPEYEVRAFGSRVDGGSGRFSDLDLVLVGSVPLDWDRLEALKDAFSNSDLPILVDLLDWQSISESFREIINKKYVVIQEKS